MKDEARKFLFDIAEAVQYMDLLAVQTSLKAEPSYYLPANPKL